MVRRYTYNKSDQIFVKTTAFSLVTRLNLVKRIRHNLLMGKLIWNSIHQELFTGSSRWIGVRDMYCSSMNNTFRVSVRRHQ